MLANWFIGEDGYYYYGESEDEIKEEMDLSKDFKFITREQWSVQDYTEIFGDELEDRNKHSMTDIPNSLLYVLNKTSISNEEKTFIMKEFMQSVLNDL